jgi:hypothetical protein
MGLKASPPYARKSDLPLLPAGLHHAIPYGIFHIGHQPPFKKDDEPKDRFYISFELPYERIEIEDEMHIKRNLPRATSGEFTRSMHRKSAWRKIMEQWEGRQFTEKECDEFDLTTLIGRNCQILLSHKMGTGANIGKTFVNVTGILPLGRSVPERKLENPPVFFSFTDCKEGEEVIFPKGMPDFMRKKAMDSPEYLHLYKCYQEAQARKNAPVQSSAPNSGPPGTTLVANSPVPVNSQQSSSHLPGDPY